MKKLLIRLGRWGPREPTAATGQMAAKNKSEKKIGHQTTRVKLIFTGAGGRKGGTREKKEREIIKSEHTTPRRQTESTAGETFSPDRST